MDISDEIESGASNIDSEIFADPWHVNTPIGIIRTDGEGSLAESLHFRRMLAKVGYSLEKTASDASSQNGVAERPHQTLAAMVRCLLYASSLSVTFWADALIYATYVNNRMYNAGVTNTPYTLWTGKRANVKHLRTFDARVSVKRSGHRPTKTDPHFYNGRFLRFTATERNIVYFDTVTGRDKTARHCQVDEFHYYGTLSSERPTGAQELLDAVFPTTAPNGQVIDCEDALFEERPDIPVPLDAIELSMEEEQPPVTAAAAVLLGRIQTEEILHLATDSSVYGPPMTLRIPLNRLPTLGILLKDDTETGQVFVRGCQEGTYCYRISRWRSTIRNSAMRFIDDIPVRNEAQVKAYVTTARARRETHVKITFAKIEVRIEEVEDIPQLHFDQLRHLNQLHTLIRQPTDATTDAFLNYTRAQLKKQPDYQEWRKSEWRQHDKCAVQDMFGEPIPCPHGAIVLPFVWDYMTKEDPLTGLLIMKARGTCNGGKKLGKAVTIAETYAACVEQPACRLYWSTTAAECLVAMGADAGNAFAEAPAPTTPFFMRIDDHFRE
jgi:ribosomal protein S12